jgi:DeoR family transcriptional regulator, suf operon transcriptional repressor
MNEQAMNENAETKVGLPMPEGRRRVLYALRRRGEASAEDVARQLEMTVSGARQHLSALLADGLVAAHEAVSPDRRRGRRTLRYRVAPAGEDYFPKAYGELTNELLGYLDDEDTGVVDRLFDRRRRQRIEGARGRLDRHDRLAGKVDELTRILDEDGYMAVWEELGPDRFLIAEHNCAIWSVAQRYGQSCSSEIDFIRAVLPDAEVERVEHKIAGDTRCGYVVQGKVVQGRG